MLDEMAEQRTNDEILKLIKELSQADSESEIKILVEHICTTSTELESQHLVQLCNYSLEWIQSKNAATVIKWKDLLPNILKVLSERDFFEANNLEYTGEEYKNDFINTLSMSDWSTNIVTSLAAMFIDMSLSKENHLKVVKKLVSYIDHMIPQELPAYTYHLLRLCKNHNGQLIFIKLQQYFALRIYNNSNFNRSDLSAESANLDLIESTINQDLLEAESTILCYIHSVALFGDNSIKSYINSLKNLQKAPEFVLQTFQLLVLFTISMVKIHKEAVFDLIRVCIARCYIEQQKKISCCWYRELVLAKCCPEDVFNQIVLACLEDKEIILESLVSFAFELLSVYSFLGKDSISEKQWSLGSMILLKIIKRKRNIAGIIIKMFNTHIINRQSAFQYIECLYIITKSMPFLMLENQSSIVELMERLVQVSDGVADQLLDALIPLSKASASIRDQLILLLRKCLYSSTLDTRLIAVNGFLKLISSMKISNLGVMSQSSADSSSSGNSLFTQISLNRTTHITCTFSNEAICLEILGILKVCFMQQIGVKAKLYEGFYGAVTMNPQLSLPILDAIWFHLDNFREPDDDILPPLNFKKIANLRNSGSVLQEPLGQLIYAASLILIKVKQSEEDNSISTITKFENFFENLCEKMPQCELSHFELDDGIDITNALPESQYKANILKESMNVYEALIGYKIGSWTIECEKHGQTINNLYQGYGRLLNFAKNMSKPKKTKKDVEVKQPTMDTSGSFKKREAQKIFSFKIPDTILNFQAVERTLQLLHRNNLAWARNSEATILKTKKDIHRHILQATVYLLKKIKNDKFINAEYSRSTFDHLTSIGCILYQQILRNIESFIDFDCASAITAAECFHAILVIVNGQFKTKLVRFLRKVGELQDGDFVTVLEPFVKKYQKLFEMEEQDHSHQDTEINKLSLIIIETLALLASLIPTYSCTLSVELLDWLKHFADNNSISTKESTAFLNLFLNMNIKYRTRVNLLQTVTINLCSVIGVFDEGPFDKKVEQFKIINEATANNSLLSFCISIKNILEDIEAVIWRIKSEYYIIIFSGEEVEKEKQSFKVKEKGVCCELYFLVTVMTNVSSIALEPGKLLEAVLKNIALLFKILALFTKYFMTKSSKNHLGFQGTSFERLVKETGKQLSPLIYRLVLYLEKNKKESAQLTPIKKKSSDALITKSKVLRETRQIPKIIYEMEQFRKSIIQLSNKTKFDLSRYVGQGTVRDFRLLDLKEALEEAGDTSVLSNSQNTSSSSASEDAEEPEKQNNSELDVMSPPPTKKSKC